MSSNVDSLGGEGLQPKQATGLWKVLDYYGKKILAELQKNLDDKKINASYNLRQSIDFDVRILGDSYVFRIKFDNKHGAGDYYKV